MALSLAAPPFVVSLDAHIGARGRAVRPKKGYSWVRPCFVPPNVAWPRLRGGSFMYTNPGLQ